MGWLSNLIRNEVKKQVQEHAVEVLQLDINGQYMVVVPDDATAKELAEAMRGRFPSSMKVVIIATPELRVIEITRPKG